MAIGDGIRRDIAKVSQAERDWFIAAILQLDTAKFYGDGVSYWDKQEDIHKNAHLAGVDVHAGPGFVPWHRELCNQLEELRREVGPGLSLPYWDFSTDPVNDPTYPGFPVSKIGLRGVALHPGEEARIRPLSTRARMSPGAREPRVPRA